MAYAYTQEELKSMLRKQAAQLQVALAAEDWKEALNRAESVGRLSTALRSWSGKVVDEARVAETTPLFI